MARGYAQSELLDMVTSTLRSTDAKGRFWMIAKEQGYQRLMCKRLLEEQRVVLGGGYGVNRQVFEHLQNNAEFVGLYESGEPRFTDHLTSLRVDYVHSRNHWMWDTKEADMNSGDEEQLSDLIAAREINCTMGMLHRCEEQLWAHPTESSTKYPLGLPSYVTFNTTGTTACSAAGFTGGVPYGWTGTTLANVDVSTYTHYKNYQDIYVTISPDDLIWKMDEAAIEIAFEAPVSRAEVINTPYDDYVIMTNKEVFLTVKKQVMAQNDNLGPDVSYDVSLGSPTFMGHPFRIASYLTQNAAASSDPVYMLNMATWFAYVLRNNYFRATEPRWKDDAPDTMVRWRMLSYNWMCVDRMANAIIAKADPFTS